MNGRKKVLLSARSVKGRKLFEIDTHRGKERFHLYLSKDELGQEIEALLRIWKRGVKMTAVLEELGESLGERLVPNIGRQEVIGLEEFVKGRFREKREALPGWAQERLRALFFVRESGLKDKELHRISVDEIKAFVETYSARVNSDNTRAKMIGAIRAIYHVAADQGYLREVPAGMPERPSVPPSTKFALTPQ